MQPLTGISVGDAMGIAYEEYGPKTASKYPSPPLEDWDGETFHPSAYLGTKAGDVSDDTQMSLALANSIIEAGEYDPEVAARHYLEWAQSAGARGMGGTIRKAMDNLAAGVSPHKSGIPGAPGTGAAMRVVPLGVAYRDAPTRELKRLVELDARITHTSHDAVDAAVLFAVLTQKMCTEQPISRDDRREVMGMALDALPTRGNVSRWAESRAQEETPEEFDEDDWDWTKNRVLDTVWCVCAAFLDTLTYEDAVRKAIRYSHDTDTNAAIIGGIVACACPVPVRWKVQVEGWAETERVQEKLLRLELR